MLFGRRLAVVLVKDKNQPEDSTVEAMKFDEIGETIVNTTAGVGTVIVVVASTLTILRMTEHVVRHVFR